MEQTMGRRIHPFYTDFLSQWHKADFVVEGRRFNCAEQYMMYSKALLFGDADTAQQILATRSSATQKKLGRAVAGFDDGVWRFFRAGIVFTGNLHKFQQNPELARELLQTGDALLVEASPKDRIWGCRPRGGRSAHPGSPAVAG